MTKDIVLLDLFSGIGGFPLGLERAGFNITRHYFSEIDKHAIANYRYNFKTAEYVGSVTDVRGRELSHRPNIITFGSPCQDFSLAGRRQGMDGQRSSLILHAIRLITECRPDVFIWENVKGTFSSNAGADFWAIIQRFANIGGYRLEWELLNTARLLPQNRERIYLIGHLGNGSGRSVFPIGEDDRLFAGTQGSGRGQTCAKDITSTTLRSNTGASADDTYISVPDKAGTLTGGGHSGGLHSDMTLIQYSSGSQDTKLSPLEGSSQTLNSGHFNQPKIMVPSATKSGHECATIGDSINLCQPESTTRRGRVGKGKAQTLETSCNQAVVLGAVTSIVLPGRHVGQNGQREKPNGEPHFTLDAAQSTGISIMQLNQSTESGGNQPYQQNRVYHTDGHVPALCSQMSSGTHAVMAVNTKQQGDARFTENCGTIGANDHKEPKSVAIGPRIRRLTEIECERLQGFDQSWRTGSEPRNWTKFGINEKGETIAISRTQRYKMLGNAVTADVVQLIGTRLIEL